VALSTVVPRHFADGVFWAEDVEPETGRSVRRDRRGVRQ
jgi:hypothetical protein